MDKLFFSLRMSKMYKATAKSSQSLCYFPIDWKDEILLLQKCTLPGLALASVLSTIMVMIKYGVKNKVFRNDEQLVCELWSYVTCVYVWMVPFTS